MFEFKNVCRGLLTIAFFHCASLAFSADVTPYLVTEKNGPWFITACVFGDSNPEIAADKAVNLCVELRRDFRLPAYVYVKEADEGNTMEGRPYYVVDEKNPEAAPQVSNKYHYLNPTVTREYAVLIGDFASVEDPRAQKALAKVRTLQPKCMMSVSSAHPLIAKNDQPLSRAFITPNPLLPREYYVAPGLDPVVLNANKDIKRYSLLDCPGKFTVQVAVLKGVTTLNQQRIAQIKENDERGLSIKGQTLSDADEKAVVLCDALRAKGFEAYVFRDRYASIVTIGSFDEVGEEKDGTFNFRPEILQIIKQFSASADPSRSGVASIKRKTLRDIPGGRQPKKEAAGIMFDPMPKVVQVPKRPLLR